MNVVLDSFVAAFYLVVLFKHLPESSRPWNVISAQCISIITCAWVAHMGLSALVNVFTIQKKIVKIWKARFSSKIEPINNNILSTGDIKNVQMNYNSPKSMLNT